MQAVREWVMTLCATAVFCAVIGRLFPDRSLGRQGRRLLPCLFLCVALIPLSSFSWSWTVPLTEPTEDTRAALDARLQQQMVQTVEETLLAMSNQALESYGLHAQKVVVDMDIDEEGGIHMGQITLYVDKKSAMRSLAVQQIAEKRLGTAVTVAQMEETTS